MLPFELQNNFEPCECCKIKYSYSTCTATTGHKWTKKEIESRLIELSVELSKKKWGMRGDTLRQIKHWTEKLERFNTLKSEFN
jgi:hypothetical protein